MKVWIVYRSWQHEGCSEPVAAFDSEQKAIDWCKKNTDRRRDYDAEYEELEVE